MFCQQRGGADFIALRQRDDTLITKALCQRDSSYLTALRQKFNHIRLFCDV